MFRMTRRERQRAWFVGLSLAPGLGLYLGLVAWPFFQTFSLSLYRFSGVSTKREFVGFGNFQRLWGEEAFWWAMRNSLTMMLVVGPLILAVSFVLAHAAQGSGGMARFLRSVYMFPSVVSVVAVALIWRNVYNPSTGLLAGLGLRGPENGWLGDVGTAFWAFSAAHVWASLGFYTMLFSAALGSVPREVREAADLEGVGVWSRFCSMTWPLTWAVRRVALVHVSIGTMSVFALANVMTDGTPSERTQTALNYLYRLMGREGEFGMAAAVGVVNIGVMILASLLVWLAFRRDPTEGVIG